MNLNMCIQYGLIIITVILFFYFVNKYENKIKKLEEQIKKNKENIEENRKNILENKEKIQTCNKNLKKDYTQQELEYMK